jgi:hypothetical protein
MEKDLKPTIELEETSFTLKGGIYIENDNVTFREFVNSWFYGEYKLIVEPDTFRSCCFDMDHILPIFGDRIISEITMKDISLFYNNLEIGGYSESTISSMHGLFSELFYATWKQGIIKFV